MAEQSDRTKRYRYSMKDVVRILADSDEEFEPDTAVGSEGEVETGEELSAVDVAADRETVPGCLPSNQ